MNKEEFLEKIEELTRKNSTESFEEIRQLIKEERAKHKYDISDDELNELSRGVDIGCIKLKISELTPDQYEEELYWRGKLISIYKLAQKEVKYEEQRMKYRYEEIQELKRQKETSKNYRGSDSKISIPKKVALAVKEVATTIGIFMKEKDVIQKLKNIVKETGYGSANVALLVGGIGILLQVLTGVPFSLSNLVACSPSIAYIGLASIIRNFASKTPFEQYEYFQSDEYKALLEEFKNAHKGEYEQLAKLTAIKEGAQNEEEKIEISMRLIELFDSLAGEADKIDGVREFCNVQALGLYREIKESLENYLDKYLDEELESDDKEKEMHRQLMKVNLEIFKRENSIKEAFRFAAKNTIKNMKIVLIAKLILSIVNPEVFPLTSIRQLAVPLAFALVNGVIDITTFKKKIKYRETEYQNKIKARNLDRIKKILEMGMGKAPIPALA